MVDSEERSERTLLTDEELDMEARWMFCHFLCMPVTLCAGYPLCPEPLCGWDWHMRDSWVQQYARAMRELERSEEGGNGDE